MAVKCNIPNLALVSVHSLLYGFSCDDATRKIVQNYLEYLKCPGVDYSFCEDFPCEGAEGDVFCSVDDVQFELEVITVNSAILTFEPPSQPYVIELIRVSDSVVLETRTNPSSPISFTGLTPATNYNVQLTLSCEGGLVKVVNFPILTMPICVEIEDFTGIAEDETI